jgi:hypothetical protein
MLVKRRLKNCKHENTNVYDYVRRDLLLDDLLHADDYRVRDRIKGLMTGMRFCLDCGSTQRFPLSDPLNGEQWLAPWIWR